MVMKAQGTLLHHHYIRAWFTVVYCGLLWFTGGHDLLHTLGMLCSTSHVIYYTDLFMFNQPCTFIGQPSSHSVLGSCILTQPTTTTICAENPPTLWLTTTSETMAIFSEA